MEGPGGGRVGAGVASWVGGVGRPGAVAGGDLVCHRVVGVEGNEGGAPGGRAVGPPSRGVGL